MRNEVILIWICSGFTARCID